MCVQKLNSFLSLKSGSNISEQFCILPSIGQVGCVCLQWTSLGLSLFFFLPLLTNLASLDLGPLPLPRKGSLPLC